MNHPHHKHPRTYPEDCADRPLLFLDVDGVLNALGGPHRRVLVDETPCDVPEGTKERVARLLEAFDPVWATAWLGRAHGAWRELLGLDRLPWPYVSYLQWKLPEIIRFAAGRPFAFVDDDADWELQELGWDPSMVDGLIVAPDHLAGLTDEHVAELLAFAKEHPRTCRADERNDDER